MTGNESQTQNFKILVGPECHYQHSTRNHKQKNTEKVSAIRNMDAPEDIGELRRFLEMNNYVDSLSAA